MAELYRYAAFISYSSKDAAFARRLHRRLESYVIPSSLGKFDLIGEGKKNRVYPVFRDREELSAGDLSDRIEAGLKASASLVVVCSPNSAASPWVQREIEHFIALNRGDRIFTIIPDNVRSLDSTGADATRACFPAALMDHALETPLAADSRRGKDGFRNAVLKLVAGMISVTPGQIINRDRARRRVRAVWQSGLALASALIIWSATSLFHEQDRRAYLARQRAHGDITLNAAFEISALPPSGAILPLGERYRGAFPLIDATPSWTGSLANVWDQGLRGWLSELPAAPTQLWLRESHGSPSVDVAEPPPATPAALLAIAPGGEFFLARRLQGGDALSIYDASSQAELAVIPHAPDPESSPSWLTQFALSRDLSKFAVLSPDLQSIAIWEFSPRPGAPHLAPAGDCFALNRDGSRLAVGRGGRVEVFDVATSSSLGRWEAQGGADGCSVTFSHSGDRVAATFSGTAWVMRVGSTEAPMPYSAGQYGLTAGILQFSSDDRLLIASGGRELFRFDVDTGDPLTPIEAGEFDADGFYGVVDPDGVLAFIDLWSMVEIWRLDEGVRVGVLDLGHDRGASMQFTPDGRYILVSDLTNRTIQFIDTTDMRAPLSQLHAQFRTPLCSPPINPQTSSERAAVSLREQFSGRERLLQEVCGRYGIADRRFWVEFSNQFRRAWESPRREVTRLRRIAGPIPASDDARPWRDVAD